MFEKTGACLHIFNFCEPFPHLHGLDNSYCGMRCVAISMYCLGLEAENSQTPLEVQQTTPITGENLERHVDQLLRIYFEPRACVLGQDAENLINLLDVRGRAEIAAALTEERDKLDVGSHCWCVFAFTLQTPTPPWT